MKQTNLKIGTQLKIAFGAIIFLIVVLGAISWQHAAKLMEQTTNLFEHPHTVRRALGELKADVLIIHRAMKDLCLSDTPDEIMENIATIDLQHANSQKQFDVLYDRYLGPVNDIDLAYRDFVAWKTIRDQTIKFVQAGNFQEAIIRTTPKGEGGQKVNNLLAHIKVIDDFANNKSNQFYSEATELRQSLNFQLMILVVSILGLTVLITWWLNQNIRQPISELANVTKQFKEGKMDIRSNNTSKNEFGQLAASFNDLAETIETEMTLNVQSAKLAGVMLSEDDAHQFCHALLSSLIEHTGAQMGAVYFLNDDKTEFERFECLGMEKEGCKPFSAVNFEGEFGQALASKKIQHIAQIPDDTRFSFHTPSGKFKPREIISIPIVSGNETIAVISLASIKSFTSTSVRLLHSIFNTLSARMGGILAYRKMIEFSQQLESQNEQLALQQKELAEANAYNRSLLEASIDPLVTIGPDGRIMDVNHATEEVTGRSRKELIGTDFTAYFTEPEIARAGYQKVFRDGYVRDYELAIQKSDETITPVLYNASVYRDQNGNVTGVFAAARDITERKKTEKELQILNQELTKRSERLSVANSELEMQKKELSVKTSELTEQNTELEMQKRQLDESNRLKTIFLSNMSHELRTPLNSVIALSGVLNRRLAGKVPEEEYSYLDVIERNGKQLLSLINDILDLSRIEAGREEIELSRFTPAELISEVMDVITPQATLKNITLNFTNSNHLPAIKSDYIKCRHILQNLVANAVKFTEVGGVEITAEQREEVVLITVTDTGIGIDQDQLPHIFDEFRQADGSSSRKYGGTGLGLAIARKYAEMLGGNIQVESAKGKGSKFMLYLPLQHTKSQTDVELYIHHMKPMSENLDTSPKNKTILLVEDTEAVIIQMKDMLESQGYTIQVARNGHEALEQINIQIPDGMILDLMMPEVDGFEVLKRIRGHEKTDRLPVIILTAKYITKDELSFLNHNHIYQIIQKGDINKEQLLSAVSSMLFPKPPEISAQRTKPAPTPRTGKPLVLIVEDNPDNMITIKALLDGKCDLVEAGDGRLGVEMAMIHQPHLILMDIALPEMNGIEALNEIRKVTALEHVPVIAVSASAMKGDREDFISLGFDGYISKPIDHKVFESTLADYLA
jgi:PAS domain S-box-containing protein